MARLLFWFQVIVAWIYMVPQVIQLAHHRTGGLTLAMWIIFLGYLFVSLSLSILSWRQTRETIRLYTVIIFAQWTAFIIALCILGFKEAVRWTNGDTVVCLSVGLFSFITIGRMGIKDPMTRGYLAVWCKGIPQLWMAYVMWNAHSSEWLPPLSLLATNASSWPRLIQVYLQGRHGGWDRPTKGLMLGEAANVATWTVVTISWIILRMI